MPDPIAPVTPTPAAESVTGASLNGELPPVNENAIRAAGATAAPAATPTPAPANPDLGQPHDAVGHSVDSLRRPFDAAKFRPEKDALGRWKNLRGGRKPGATARPATPAAGGTPAATPRPSASYVPPDLPRPGAPATPAATPASTPAPAAAPIVSPEEYAATAEGYIALGVPIVGAFVGDEKEWEPDDTAERDRIRAALADYLRAAGVKPTTPLGRFVAVVGGYVWKRLTRPKTAKFIARRWPTFAGLLGIPVERKPAADPIDAATAAAPAPAQPRDPFASAALPRP